MILNTEQIQQKARELALVHRPRSGANGPVKRFSADLSLAMTSLNDFVRFLQNNPASHLQPAEEWLLDHAVYLDEQAQLIRYELTEGSFHRLPFLRPDGQIRVFMLCNDYFSYTDGIWDPDSFTACVNAYQEVAVLTIAEVWSLPLMLRMALMHRLHTLMRKVQERREVRTEVDRLLAPIDLSKPDPEALRQALDQAGERIPLSGPLVAYLTSRLGEWSDSGSVVREWVQCRLENSPESMENIVGYEHKLQASYGVSAGNMIQSIRSITRSDWQETFEQLSMSDRTLRKEPSGMYPKLDDTSREVLLKRVEELARRLHMPENRIADQAVELAEQASPEQEVKKGESAPRNTFAAFYLLDPKGVNKLRQALKLCGKPRALPASMIRRYSAASYFSTAGVLFLVLMAAASLWTSAAIHRHLALWLIMLPILAIPVSEWTISAVHWVIGRASLSRPLLRYDYTAGIPEEASTMVVIPVIWSHPGEVREMADRLELHYLANRDPRLHYALLGDYADSGQEATEEDQALLETAQACVDALNQRYGGEKGASSTFHLYQRARKWNDSEGVWMGWERKRGKLVEFVELIKGAKDTSYQFRVGDPDILGGIRYIITLDADTQLPIGTAPRMVGSIDLPYNRPRLNANGTRVTAGYGVLQPRIGISHEAAQRTRFAHVWTGEPGIDPYSFAVSDPYQDGFDEGIFTGKGIFDVDTFHKVLCGRIPDNKVLSHDLLEGGFLRAGLLSDVELIDGHPAVFSAYQQRLHRWVRGDWQLLCWLLPRTADRCGELLPVDLSALTRWQIIDNLRRSLVLPALFALLAIHLFLPPYAAGALLVMAAITLALPIIRACMHPARLLHRPDIAAAAAAQAGVTLLTLPFQAVQMLDAIIRSLYRLFVSRKRLLEWVSSAEIERRGSLDTPVICGMRGGYMLIVLFAGASVALGNPFTVLTGLLLSVIWALAPLVIRMLDQPAEQPAESFSEGEKEELISLASQIWKYYEDFATAKENWLPPDNVQIDPPNGIAHRTSPTNIGLQLACTITARDFGFIDTPGMIERLERTVGTIERMEKWSGHLYNWYDTETLRPLPPVYVSTVDSGNLAGYLIAAKEGAAEWLRRDLPASAAGQDHAAARLPGIRRGSIAAVNAGAMRPLGDAGRPVMAEMEAADETSGGTGLMERETGKNGDALRPGIRERSSARTDRAAKVEGDAPDWKQRGQRMISRLEKLVSDMDFRPLYDSRSGLFTLGYHAAADQCETILYDILASEARQASFIAVALGQVPASHWFKLGRAMAKVGKESALVSWSGTMFEYLMPPLIMRTYKNTMWDETYRSVVKRQTEYARQRGVPMGISESGYYAFDYQMNYQYRAFGVPGLGFKQGLEQDLVVAPYAAVMALPYTQRAGLQELRQLERLGAKGKYGYYEAVDCTSERLPRGRTHVVISSFMAHHQGMSLLTLGNMLLPESMVDRFHRDKRMQAAELLLQERMPDKPAILPRYVSRSARDSHVQPGSQMAPLREYTGAITRVPEVCVLSNGTFTTVVSNSGAGFSRSGDIAVTRWREDPVRDNWGSYLYIRDVAEDTVWSPGQQPVGRPSEDSRVQFMLEKARFTRTDGKIGTRLDICVSPEWNAEVRRLSLTNNGSETRIMEVTTYMELALAPPAADDAHPAFSKLFVQTEFDEAGENLLACRRPRTPEDKPIWAVHSLASSCEKIGPLEYETDRACFIGRGASLASPQAIRSRLSGTVGAVLDPAFIIRRRITIGPGETVSLTAVTGIAGSREEALNLAGRFCSDQQVERTFQLAWNYSQIELRHLHLTAEEANRFQTMAGRVLYTPPLQQEREQGIRANRLGQSGLWKLGISGDLPIVLLRLKDTSALPFAVMLLRGHEYLCRSGIPFDLAVLAESAGGYQQELQEGVRRAAEQNTNRTDAHRPGGVFPLSADQLGEQGRALLIAAARLSFRAGGRSLEGQLKIHGNTRELPAPLAPAQPETTPSAVSVKHETGHSPQEELLFFNGWGGFTADGREYRIQLPQGKDLPAPWTNVMANPAFGCMITELGSGYTWFRNSREFKLTPWTNDPVLDQPGEVLYLRDEQNGAVWSVTPSPVPPAEASTISHGRGYTRFERESQGLRQQMTILVPPDDAVKVITLTLDNLTDQPKNLSLTYYAEWVLGVRREDNAAAIETDWNDSVQCLFARNTYQEIFRNETAFVRFAAPESVLSDLSWTSDREEFIGRDGSLASPAALGRERLSGAAGVFANACGALQAKLTILPGGKATAYIVMGAGTSVEEASALAQKYGDESRCAETLAATETFWSGVLDQLHVTTPSREMNVMLNGWLLYQTLACRIWARTAFYQAGGAYGFRDQIQDSLSLLHTRPDLTRAQIVLHAGHQYLEGDVQHWWHAETGRGIRTRYSDDLLWLPYAAARYIMHSGDKALLDEVRPFLTSEPLKPEEHERYESTVVSEEKGTVYEHCLRAIDRSLGTGPNGLPLMGIGDWNDGMNRVGNDGKGESVWLGWFLCEVLALFAPYCELQGDAARAQHYRAKREELSDALVTHGWDGEWFRRASTDEGHWLGSNRNKECRIDAIAQSWSVISGAAPKDKALQAMQAFDRELVSRELDLAQLLTPPFDATEPSPGYIQGYPPGIRENGGQYTHGVIWSIVAWSILGEGGKAFELFHMLNPVSHTGSPAEVRRYAGEPYVMAADVYLSDPFKGRAGWTWYTGAAGWMYQAGVEWILGLQKRGERLYIKPCIPAEWPGFSANYRFGGSVYEITVRRESAAAADDAPLQPAIRNTGGVLEDESGTYLELRDDGAKHEVTVTL